MVQFGVIGCGKIGTRHLSFLSKMDGVRIRGVADIIESRAQKAGETHNTQYFTNYADLLALDDLDVVTICTPTGHHPEATIAALKAGKHVICEKPMSLSVADADAMIAAATESGKHLFVVKQNRFNLPIRAVSEALNQGLFGKLYTITANVIWNRRNEYYEEEAWRGTLDLDGGALSTQASHFLDTIQWIGGPVKSVFAQTDTFTHDIEAEDTGAVILRFESGAIGTIYYTTCAYDHNIEGSLTILGEKGSVKVGGEYLNKIEHWNVAGSPPPKQLEEQSPANDYGSYRGSASKHDAVFRQAIRKIIGDEEASIVDGHGGRKTVEIIEAVHLSAKTGKEIHLPLTTSTQETQKEEETPSRQIY